MSHLPILIVGAGPTGLMMACELARHDISFRIIDKKSEPTQGSNATWVQTRTLEIFENMGIVDRFLKIGHRCEAVNLYEKGELSLSLPFNQINSLYPYVLMVPQSETERLLIKKLEEFNIQVERSTELMEVNQTSKGVVSVIRKKNGDTENIDSSWLIACDGANSTVREKCHLAFPGENITEQFMVADAQMHSYLPTNEIHVFLDKGTIFPDRATLFSAFPWDNSHYRLTANLYVGAARQSFTEQEVKEVVSERTYGNYMVDSVSWISPFWIHDKIVKTFRENFIFLAGDAAHIHSPVGGQGMNTGIQDAYNLAWKLACMIKNKGHKKLLESYQLERYPIDKNIVKQTDLLTKSMLYDKNFFSKLKKFNTKMLKQPSMAINIAKELTQLNLRYAKSPIIDYKQKLSKKSPRQGELAPNLKLAPQHSLYQYFNHNLHTVLIFTGENPTKLSTNKIKSFEKLIHKNFSSLAKIFIVSRSNMVENEFISDENGEIHHLFNITKPAMYIIRPDNYIGSYSSKFSLNDVKKYFQIFTDKMK